jgi:hypothetical protein
VLDHFNDPGYGRARSQFGTCALVKGGIVDNELQWKCM